MKKRKMRVTFLCALIGATVMLYGCGSDGYSTAATASEAAYDINGYDVAEYAMEDSAVYEDKAYGEFEDDNVIETDTSRKLITTVNISSETEDMTQTMSLVEAKTKELSGYIESSNVYNGTSYYSSSYRQSRSANYTIRIPSSKLDLFISSVEEGTNITNKSVNVDGVTLQYVDIESKKKALKTEEQRLLEILEKAETVEDIIAVEDKLSDVRYNLESIESQLRTYDNKVDYSTVYLDIDEVTQYTPAEEKGILQRISEGLSYNFKKVIDAIVNFFIWLIVHIPQIIVLAIVCLIVVFVVKKCSASAKRKRIAKMQANQQDNNINGNN